MEPSAALVQHLSNKDSIALHFKCITKVEKMSPYNPEVGTHVVVEVRYGVDAIFVIDHHFGSNREDIKATIKTAIDSESFGEIKDVGGTLYIDKIFGIPFEVKTIENMLLLCNRLKESSRDKKFNSISIPPIEVKLFSNVSLLKIDPMITEQIAVVLQHLNSALVKCTQMMELVKLESIALCTKIELVQSLIKTHIINLKQTISNLLPQIRKGSENVLRLKEITDKHLKSPFSKELDLWIARIEDDIGTLMTHYSLIDEGKSLRIFV